MSPFLTLTHLLRRSAFRLFSVCYQPDIRRLSPNTVMPRPKTYGKRRSFHVTADVTIRCASLYVTHFEWQIYKHSSNTSSLVQLSLSVKKQGKRISISAGTLDYGVYEFRFTANISAFRNMSSTRSSYIEITESNSTANPVKFGTSMITSGHSQDLVLDPGQYSIDPDTRQFNPSVSD